MSSLGVRFKFMLASAQTDKRSGSANCPSGRARLCRIVAPLALNAKRCIAMNEAQANFPHRFRRRLVLDCQLSDKSQGQQDDRNHGDTSCYCRPG